MANNSKSKLLFIALLLMLLLISSAYSFLMPTVNAAELDLQEKAVSVVNNVVGLETERYTTRQDVKQLDSKFFGYQQIETSTYLTSEEGSVRVTCSYVKDTLKLVYLSDVEGEISLKQPKANTVEMAKGLLERYQNYAGDSSYGEFASMLDDVKANTDLTKYAGNIKLVVSGSDQSNAKYKWTYIDDNGVVAESKNVILKYEQGQFQAFFNNWPFYTIVDTAPKISSEEATAIAIDASKSYTYQVTDENDAEKTVSGFTIAAESLGRAKLIYVNNKEEDYARGGDPFKLYLAWHVPLGFDEFYPGDVSGMTVILWADTGEVCGMNRVITDAGLASSEDTEVHVEKEANLQTVNQQSIMLPAAFVIAAVICMVLVVTYKRTTLVSKKLVSKSWATLLCTIVMFSVMLFTPITNAASLTGRSRIYACLEGDGYDDGGTADDYEAIATAYACNHVGNLSLSEGYVTSNLYGPWGTTATSVVNQAGSDEQNYMGTIVFHAGHLYDFNTAYQDNYGDPIYAADIYDETDLGRHFFIFIWVCNQAINAGADSMAEAWTHRDDSGGGAYMTEVYDDEEGYQSSDGYGQCYIGFQGFSPMLSNHYEAIGGNYSVFYEHNTESTDVGPAKEFIVFFYYYAFEGYSVRNSLDLASSAYFDSDYSSSVLNTGYNSWWPGGEKWLSTETPYLNASGYFPVDYPVEYQENRMKVFGDANIKLCQSDLTLSGVDDSSNPLSPVFTIDDQTQYSSSCQLVSKSYEVDVNDLPNYDFSHFSYDGVNYYDRPADILLDEDGTLTAHYTWDPVYYDLTVSKTGTGTTNPASGTSYPYLSYTYAQVTATPGANMMHYWSGAVSEGSIWKPTISVLMSGDRSVQANFVAATAYNFVSYVESSDGAVIDDYKICGPYPNGQFAVTSANENYDIYGEITTHLYFTTLGHIYVYAKAVAAGGPLDVYTSADGYNWNYIGAASVSSTNPSWIDCGYTLTPFSYIRFRTEDGACSIAIDSVRIDTAFHTLTPTTSGSGTINPSSPVQCLNDTYKYVTAQANSGWAFDHWEIDDVPQQGSNPYINVHMLADHTVRAVFVQVPPSYVSSVTGTYGAVANPSYLVGSQPNGQYASIDAMEYYYVYGWISGALNQQTAGHIYVYGYGGSGTLQVYTSTDGNSWTLRSSPTINQGSPSWIDCGTCATQFSYIKLQTVLDGVYTIYIDAVKVQP